MPKICSRCFQLRKSREEKDLSFVELMKLHCEQYICNKCETYLKSPKLKYDPDNKIELF